MSTCVAFTALMLSFSDMTQHRDGYKYEHWGGWYRAHEMFLSKLALIF
jgi:hypothetical protein